MHKATDPDVFAIVTSNDGTYVACTTAEEALVAADAVRAAGEKAAVFHLPGSGRPDVMNVASGPGTRVQAHTIHGGVNLR